MKWLSRKVALGIVAGVVIILRPELALYAVITYGIYTVGNIAEHYAKKEA